jgi:hypothetical protein
MTRTLSATLTAVVLLAACGGERREGSATRSDSAMTAAATPADSTARADSTTGQAAAPAAGAPAESAASAPKAAAPTSAAKPADTGARRSTASKTPPKKPPAAPAQQDTTKASAPTATAQAPAPQDTGKAAAAPAPAAAASDQPDQPLRDAYHQAPRDTVDEATYDGWKQFNLNCARCHGEDVLGTTIAPHLILSLKPNGPINTKELFMQTVCAGRPAKGMPAWCALGLDMGKIQDIYAYVKGRSDAKIGPGRPAVKQGG